ncbi:hypothetical protein VR610_09600 [Aquirufa regiilacus]
MFRIIVMVLLLVGLNPVDSNAQMWFLGQKGRKKSPFPVFKKHTSVSFGAGSSHYIGDLVPVAGLFSVAAQTTRWNVGVNFTRHLSPNFSANLGLNYIRIAGDDSYFSPVGDWDANFLRNLHFRNDIKELSLVGMYEIGGNPENNLKRNAVSPYVYLGVTGFLHSPDARKQAGVDVSGNPVQSPWLSESNASLLDYKNEGVDYSLMGISIPFGVGFRYKITSSMDVGFDFGYRIALTDYLDDVTDIRSSVVPLSIAGSMLYTDRSGEPFAANTLVNRIPVPSTVSAPKISTGPDQYFTTQIRLIYHLRNKIDCPPLPIQ